MDITVPPEVGELARRTREFIRDVVIPVEEEVGGSVHAAPDELRRSLQKQAEQAGLLAPHVPTEWGGCGLDVRGQSVVFEEAGYSLLGPLALNCSAPDEGNMHLLEVVASEEQKEKYLRPLAAGETRSCFAMTEPAPGSGSDPSMLSTAATKVDGGWRIDGRKWFISGAHGAGFAICMARTSGAPGERGGATMFLVDAGQPGHARRPGHRNARRGAVRRAQRGRLRRLRRRAGRPSWARSTADSSTPRCGWRRPG